jgi:penicillin-insensitive murein endopeptidase
LSSRESAIAFLALGLSVACSSTPTPLAPTLLGTVGSPAHGVLVGGLELPKEGPGFRWFNRAGHHYGVARLVTALAEAAAIVEDERPGGAPLLVGDLSKRLGGQIAGHRTHRSGRDVDLLFYAETPGGDPVRSPGFLPFGPDGLAFIPPDRGGPRFVRLDVPREWLLIKSLLTNPDANVQWMFISSPLEALITEYARARGEELDLVWRAESVMIQPTDSLPHDDHLHLRTACTAEEVIVGCEGGGPHWPWLPPLPALEMDETDDALALALLAPIPTESKRAEAPADPRGPAADQVGR